MSLVSSNDASAAAELAAQAREAYFTRTGSAGSAADCAELLAAGLRGVGPATASLLMAVMDPAGAIFFSDEAFAWLCGDAKPRYSAGEYRDLLRRAEGLKTRLGVGATEIEQVAYVAVRTGRAGEAGLSEDKTSGQAKGEVAKGKAQGKAATKATPKDKGESTVEAKDEPDTAKDSKRKAEAKTDAPLRRSKRTRA